MTSDSQPLPEDQPIPQLDDDDERDSGAGEPAPGTTATNTTDRTVLGTPDVPEGDTGSRRSARGGADAERDAP